MTKWFCADTSSLEPAIKMAANAAGFAIAKNNVDLVKRILPVAQGIQKTVDAGTDNAALNSILKETVTELLPLVSDNPLIQMAVEAALTAVNINVPAGTFPALGNPEIKDLVDSFVAGLGTGAI